MTLTKTLPLAAALLVQPLSVFATPLPATGVFTYTSQCLSADGAIAGFRVALLRTKDATKTQIDFSEPGAELHDIGRDIRFDAKSGALSFSYKGKAAHVFAGTVTKETLTGSFDKGKPATLRVVEAKGTEWALETLRPCAK